MLERGDAKLTVHGFIVACEIVDGGPPPTEVGMKLADALQWVEGVGEVTVDWLGDVGPDASPEAEQDLSQPELPFKES